MDERLRTKARDKTLTSRDLQRAGFPILHCHGSATMALLRKAGWFVLEEFTHIEKDCGNWTHCGPTCCGPCPTCGDKPTKTKRTLVAPFQPMSKSLARRMLHRTMAQAKKEK